MKKENKKIFVDTAINRKTNQQNGENINDENWYDWHKTHNLSLQIIAMNIMKLIPETNSSRAGSSL